MKEKMDVWQGTLALIVLETLKTMGPLHGFGIARQIEQISRNSLSVKSGDFVSGPAQTGAGGLCLGSVGHSDNNRRAKYYSLTAAGKKQLVKQAREWEQTTAAVARFFSPSEGV